MAPQIEIPTFETFKLNYNKQKEAEQVARTLCGAKAPRCAKPYNPEDEIPPDVPWYRLDKPDADAQIRGIVDQLLGVINNAREKDKELSLLRRSATDVREVVPVKTRDIPMVGQQGVGKSLLINALLDRSDLSKTSASGRACTASAIKYVHRPGAMDREDIYDAAVHFMDDHDLREITEEHIRHYDYYYYHLAVANPGVQAEKEGAPTNVENYRDEEKRNAATAEEFLYHIFNVKNVPEAGPRLRKLLTHQSIESGVLLNASIREAHHRIQEAGASEKRIKNFRELKIDKLMAEIENYITPHDILPSFWPIVQHVSIFLGSSLTRNGVCVIDLPGLGDLNQSRTAATNAIRRKAEFEIILAKPGRLMTEIMTDDLIKQSIRAHGAKNTIVVLTKSDEACGDDNAILTFIKTSQQHPLPLLKGFIADNDSIIEKLDIAYTNGNNDTDYDALTDESETREHYHSHLMEIVQRIFIQQRAEELEKDVRNAYEDEDPDPIKVFTITSNFYLRWLNPRAKTRPILTAEETGIPSLRRFLLGLSAEDNFHNYRNHAFHKLPRLLDKATRIAHSDKKDDAYEVIRPGFRQRVADIKAQLQESFRCFSEDGVLNVWDQLQKPGRLREISEVVVKWGEGVKWNTYNMALRQRGLAKTKAIKYKDLPGINWNEDIMKKLTSDMEKWKRKMNKAVTLFSKDREKSIAFLCGEVFTSISSSSLATPLKVIAIDEWTKCKVRILAASRRLEGILKNGVKETWKYATTETDIRCMIAKINTPTYDSVVKVPNRTNWYSSQRELMLVAIRGPDEDGNTIMDKIAIAVHTNAKQTLGSVWYTFLTDLIEELETFDEHIGERLPVDYQIEQVDHDIRDSLKAILPQLWKQVKELQNMIEDLDTKQEDDEEVPHDIIDAEESKEEPEEHSLAQGSADNSEASGRPEQPVSLGITEHTDTIESEEQLPQEEPPAKKQKLLDPNAQNNNSEDSQNGFVLSVFG